MVSEEQKKAFKEKLDEVFTVAKSDDIEATGQLRTWLRNLFFRYKNYKTNTHPEHILPKEHLLTLETKLKEEDLTLDEFENTQGKIELLIETIKTKPESLEKLIELRDKRIDEVHKLERKLSKRSLYRLTDEAANEIEKQIKEIRVIIKDTNKKIDELTPKEEKKEEKPSETASKRIKELIKENKKQRAELSSLQEELLKYKEERSYINSKYRDEYEKNLKIRTQQLEEEFNGKVQEEIKKQTEKTNKRIIENKPIQKGIIRKLLLTENIVSLEDMKARLKLAGVSSNKIEFALNELRNEIPGIVKNIDNETYSISASATNRLDGLKKSTICPRISSVFSGTIEFIVRSDLHLPLTSNEDRIKKEFEPYFTFCSNNRNIPIIDLGDIADTLRNMKYPKWENRDKEATKQAYDFFKYYAKVLSTAPKIKHYNLLGNHDKHPYLVGVDPIEVINSYTDNVTILGIDKGSFMLGNDKIGVFHEIDSVPFTKKEEIYDTICEEMRNITPNYIYSLVGHYHTGMHNPLQQFSLIPNRKPLLFSVEIEDGIVKRIFVSEMSNTAKSNNQIELYNSSYQYKKKSH